MLSEYSSGRPWKRNFHFAANEHLWQYAYHMFNMRTHEPNETVTIHVCHIRYIKYNVYDTLTWRNVTYRSRTTRREPFIQCAFVVASTIVVVVVVVGGLAYANPPYPSVTSSRMLKQCTDICVYVLNEIIGFLTTKQQQNHSKKQSTPFNVVVMTVCVPIHYYIVWSIYAYLSFCSQMVAIILLVTFSKSLIFCYSNYIRSDY